MSPDLSLLPHITDRKQVPIFRDKWRSKRHEWGSASWLITKRRKNCYTFDYCCWKRMVGLLGLNRYGLNGWNEHGGISV